VGELREGVREGGGVYGVGGDGVWGSEGGGGGGVGTVSGGGKGAAIWGEDIV